VITQQEIDLLKKSGRTWAILGNKLGITEKGFRKGGIEYYQPSARSSEVENTFIYGPSGSGKTWTCFNLIGQSFFAEKRSWIIFDTKGSVTHDTTIHIKINGVERVVKIGDLVDILIPMSTGDHDAIPVTSMQLETLSICSNHKAKWLPVASVSKHKSPEKLLRITTRSGRVITATANHSFLMLKKGRYVPIKGSTLKIGDPVPICSSIPMGTLQSINVLDYFPPSEIIDFDQIQTTIDVINGQHVPMTIAYQNSGLQTITYSALSRYKNGELPIPTGKFKLVTKNNGKTKAFPKELQLTRNFGFFCGMFIAEGYAVNHYADRSITITNQDSHLIDKVIEWINHVGLYYKKQYHKNSLKGIRIRSLPLTRLLTTWFGDGTVTNSGTKFIPPFIFNANEDFLKGFLDGYMSGDGSIRPFPRRGLTFATKSKRLQQDLNVLFSKFGMTVRFSSSKTSIGNDIHVGEFSLSDIYKFNEIGFSHAKKQHRLNEYPPIDPKSSDAKQIIDLDHVLSGLSHRKMPPSISSGISTKKSSIITACRIYDDLKNDYPKRASKLKTMINGDVWWDHITEIKKLPTTSDYVYDLQVNESENFVLGNGTFVHNSYLGCHKPNTAFGKQLRENGLRPMGIPQKLMKVIAPEFYVTSLNPSDIRDDWITNMYKIPIAFSSLPILFGITNMSAGSQYGATYDVAWKELMKRTHRKPTLEDVMEMLQMMMDGAPSGSQRWYETLMNAISRVADLTLTNDRWSPVGKALLQSAIDKKPRWIVVTFKHAEYSGDPINLAIYSAIFEEIRAIAEMSIKKKWDLRIGTFVDELQYFAPKDNAKDNIALKTTKECIYRWGRTNKIWRVWATQRNEHLVTLLQDRIEKFSRDGTYQKVIKCFSINEPGYCSLMDRQRAHKLNLNLPYFVPIIKSAPPMFEVEVPVEPLRVRDRSPQTDS